MRYPCAVQEGMVKLEGRKSERRKHLHDVTSHQIKEVGAVVVTHFDKVMPTQTA